MRKTNHNDILDTISGSATKTIIIPLSSSNSLNTYFDVRVQTSMHEWTNIPILI